MPDITVTVTNPVTRVVSVSSAGSANVDALATRLVETGSYLESQIKVSAAGVTSLGGQSGALLLTGAGSVNVAYANSVFTISGAAATGDYYPNNNPSGYITGIDTSSFALKSQTGDFITEGQTGEFYAKSNPSGYITNSALSTYIQTSQTGQFAPAALTGNFITTSQTGLFAQADLTGNFVSSSQTGAYVNTFASHTQTGNALVGKNQTGIYSGSFYPLNSNPAGYVTGSTGGFVAVGQTGILVGKNETGVFTNSFYPLNTNPSNYLTGSTGGFVSVTQTGQFAPAALTGSFVTNGQTGSFATTGFVTGVSGVLSAQTAATGSYLYGLIQASSAGVSSLNSQSGSMSIVGAGNVFVTTNGQTITVSGSGSAGVTGDYVNRSETGEYHNTFVNNSETGVYTNTFVSKSESGQFAPTALTGAFITTGQTGQFTPAALTGNFVTTSQTGAYTNTFPTHTQTGASLVGKNQTGIYSGSFYPLNGNPSGYITGSTGGFLSASQTGILVGDNETGSFITTGQTGQFYAASNPAGYITNSALNGYIQSSQTGAFATTGYVTGVSGVITTRLESTGTYLYSLIQASSAGVSSLNSQSGSITLAGAGNVSIITNGQTITASGDTGAYANFALKADTGSFVTTSQTGQFAPAALTGSFVTTTQTGAYTNTFASHTQTGNTLVGKNQTGIYSGSFYPLNSNPSAYLTGSTGGFLSASQTGIYSGTFYPLNSNPAGYVTGSTGGFLSESQTGILVGKNETGVYTNSFYPLNTNPSNYLTGSTGGFVSVTQTGIYSGTFYPLSSNPNGYLTGSTGGFLSVSQTGILVGKNETGIYANSFYPLNSNPSNYVTTAQTGSFATTGYVTGVSGVLVSRLDATGAAILSLVQASSAGVSALNGLSGNLTLTGAGGVTVTIDGSTFTFSGSPSTGSYSSIASGRMWEKSLYVFEPTSYEDISWFNKESISLDSIVSVSRGTGAAIGWTLSQSTNRGQTGSLIVSGYTDSLTTGNSVMSFSDSVISGDVFLLFRTQSTSGTIGDLSFNIVGQPIAFGASTGDFVRRDETGIYGNSFYPLNSNPSSYTTTGDAASTSGVLVSRIDATGAAIIAMIGGGGLTTGINGGTGYGIFSGVSGTTAIFKSIVGGSGVSLSGDENTLYINLTVGQRTGITPTGDIPLTVAHQFSTVVSGNLPAGTYLMAPRTLVYGTANALVKATTKLWSNGHVHSAGTDIAAALGAGNSGCLNMSWSDIVTLTSGTNPIAVSVAGSLINSRVKLSPIDYATGIIGDASSSLDILRLF
jgi:hypothetical protein